MGSRQNLSSSEMSIIPSITNMFNSLSGNSFIGKLGIAAGSLLTAYFTPIVGLLVTCFACTVVDMYYGIKRAHKLGQKITSRKNWKGTLLKVRDEFALIMLAHMIEFTVLGETATFVLSGGVTVIIALTEIWSIIENLNTIDPSGPWRALGAFLKKKGEDYIGTTLDLNNNDQHDNESADSSAA